MKVDKPKRVTRTWTQQLVAPPHEVMPLLCPVREADWIEGWDPGDVFTGSGVVEDDCVFTTGDAIWYVTLHDPGENLVEKIKITPGVTACRLTIELEATDAGTDATVTYMHTSLGPAGDAFVAGFTAEHYREFMEDWERRLNHYLATGEKLV